MRRLICVEGVWHRGILKVMVVVAMGMRMRMAAGRAQGCGKHVNKQLDKSPRPNGVRVHVQISRIHPT